jgi:hypothetical protein
MNGNNGKSKKVNRAANPETPANVSAKSREEKEGQQTREKKTETTLPTDPTTTEDTVSDQSVKTTLTTDLSTSSEKSLGPGSESHNVMIREQQYAIANVLDVAKENVANAAEEARREIPRYTETMRSYQEQIIQSAHEVAENYINVQKEIINSMESSLLPYWENFYTVIGAAWWILPRRMIEAYANMVSGFAGNTLRTTQLVNNGMLANMDAFKKTVDQARESSNDLARACVNFAKKIERDSVDATDDAVAQGNAAKKVVKL